MSITPVNVSDATKAVERAFKDGCDETCTIERAEPINEQPSRCPWVGIYRTGVRYPSRALTGRSGYRQQRIGLAIIAQQSDPNSGAECEDALETLIQTVMGILLTDETLKGVVDVLDEVQVTYQNYGLVDSAYMQTAVIEIVGVVNVSGG